MVLFEASKLDIFKLVHTFQMYLPLNITGESRYIHLVVALDQSKLNQIVCWYLKVLIMQGHIDLD